MANSDKNLVITPNVGEPNGTDPEIVLSAADADTGPTNFAIKTLPGHGGTISIDAGGNQLWTIKNNIEGKVFSVTTPSGYEAIYAKDNQVVFCESVGRLNIPAKPAFKVENTTSTSAFAAEAVATWNNISYNNYECFNSGDRFTAPHEGIYHFSCMMLSNSNTRLFHRFKINGADVFGTWSESYQGTNYQTNTISMTVPLNKNDYVQVYVRVNPGYGANYANFNGFQVG